MDVLGYDFAIFWEAGRAFIAGQSPYSVEGFFSPLPFLIAVLPIVILPYGVAFALWTVLNLAALARLARQRKFIAALFLPALFALWVGQADVGIVALAFTGTWWGVALSTLKPQLAAWLVPFFIASWWRAGDKRAIIKMVSTALVLYGVPTVLYPTWWEAWFRSTPSVLQYSEHASSLFGISALLAPAVPLPLSFAVLVVVGVVAFLALRPFSNSQYWSYAALFNPLANIYSQCLLIPQADWIAIALSWLLLPLALYLHTGLPWAVVPLYLLWRARRSPSKSLEAAGPAQG